MRFARQIGNVHEARGDFVAAAGHADAVFEDRGERATIEWPQVFFFAERAQASGIFGDDRYRSWPFLRQIPRAP